MDLKQRRLTREEWTNIEILVPEQEKQILKLIIDGFKDPTIHYNTNQSLISLMKIDANHEIHQYLYKTYFEQQIAILSAQIHHNYTPLAIKKQMNKKDQIRVENTNQNIAQIKAQAFEFILLDLANKAVHPENINTNDKARNDKARNDKARSDKARSDKAPSHNLESLKAYYTLIQLLQPSTTITNINPLLLQFIGTVIEWCSRIITIDALFYEAHAIIETNHYLLKYQDIRLFEHQRKLYDFLHNHDPQVPALIFYTSPTGNGKTLTPLGLVTQYRVIFICASRHIGLALAKSAISMERRIAIAFGCETADDIRLHYFSAEVYTKNHKSGGIYKVDNSYGNNVELMICDVMSYTVAMHYMLSFNPEYKIITFWDEPTISMDVDDHPLHPIINANWCENKITKVVLSCATMPKELELLPTITDFKMRFIGATVKTISSFDFKKTIRIVNSDGYPVLPHTLFPNYRDVIECVNHCRDNQTLLRYIDLASIIDFIKQSGSIVNLSHFTPETLTMTNIKLYYLELLSNIDEWHTIQHQPLFRKATKEGTTIRKINSESHSPVPVKGGGVISRTQSTPPGLQLSASSTHSNGCVFLSTIDAYTLTDGPTLYLVEDTIKIGKFLFQQSKIPESIVQNIVACIEHNNKLEERIVELQKKMEDSSQTTTNGDEKRDKEGSREVRDMAEFIESLRKQIRPTQLPSQYIPNTTAHQTFWCSDINGDNGAFTANVDDAFIKRVMELGSLISGDVKILLMMGIGIFCEDLPIPYLEIVKELSYSQKLYIIIATSDYIYGTNYQFCHGFLGRDLANMTPQKIIQAMGRIGRGNIQQNYTVRYRNDDLLRRLFLPLEDGFNKEAEIMNQLFCT